MESAKSYFILGLGSNTSKQYMNLFIEDRLVTDSLDIANGFNNYFVSIGPKLAQDLTSDIDPLSYVDYNMNSIATPKILGNQVREVINLLNNSSLGHDELPPHVAKSCIAGLNQPITYLVNESLKSGICPSELKLARVVPIFKFDDPSLLSKYSPITDLYLCYRFSRKILRKLFTI